MNGCLLLNCRYKVSQHSIMLGELSECTGLNFAQIRSRTCINMSNVGSPLQTDSPESSCKYRDVLTARHQGSGMLQLPSTHLRVLADDWKAESCHRLYRPLISQQIRILELECGTGVQPLRCRLLRATLTSVDGCRLDEESGPRELVEFDALSYSWVSALQSPTQQPSRSNSR